MTSETPQPRPEAPAAPTAPAEGGAPRPPAPMAPRGPRPSYGGGRPSYGGGGGDRGGSGGPGGPRRPRRKVCSFCVDKVQKIDYKDVGRIRRYISERGKIDPRRKSGSCAKHQRMLTTALKRARFMALLPYTADHVRGLMSPQARAMAGGPPPPKPERGPWRPAGSSAPRATSVPQASSDPLLGRSFLRRVRPHRKVLRRCRRARPPPAAAPQAAAAAARGRATSSRRRSAELVASRVSVVGLRRREERRDERHVADDDAEGEQRDADRDPALGSLERERDRAAAQDPSPEPNSSDSQRRDDDANAVVNGVTASRPDRTSHSVAAANSAAGMTKSVPVRRIPGTARGTRRSAAGTSRRRPR